MASGYIYSLSVNLWLLFAERQRERRNFAVNDAEYVYRWRISCSIPIRDLSFMLCAYWRGYAFALVLLVAKVGCRPASVAHI